MWEVYNGHISSARSILELAISEMARSRDEAKNKADVERIEPGKAKKRKTAKEDVVEGINRKKRKRGKGDNRDKGDKSDKVGKEKLGRNR
jgi:hypothetical protein